MENRALSPVISILLLIGLLVVAGAVVSVFIFDTTEEGEENTGEPSVRVSDTNSGRVVTLIRKGEVGQVTIESGNKTYNLTEVGESVTLSRQNGTLIYAERSGDRELIRQVEPNPITTLNVDTDNFTVTNGSLLVSFEASKKVSNIEVEIGGNQSGLLTEEDFTLAKEFNKSGETWYRYRAKTELRAYYVVGKLQTAATSGVDGARGQEAVLDLPKPDWLCDRGNLTTTCYVNSSKDLTGNYTIVIGNLTLEKNASVTTGSGPDTTATLDVGENTTLDCGDMRGNFNITADSILVKSCSSIIANGYGYSTGNGPCPGSKRDSYASGGGGYGGIGGTVPGSGGGGGCKYGSLTQPTSLGSGAGAGDGSGGGRVYLDAAQVTVNGTISVNGSDSTDADNGGGAGGAVYIDSNSFEGNGSLYARGGRGSDKFRGGGGGGGAGGRIAVHFSSEDWSGITSARSGLTTDGVYGGYGSIYFENTSSGAMIRSDPCRLTGLYECDILTGRDRNGDGLVSSSTSNHTVVIPSGEVPELEADKGRLNVSGERLIVNGTIRGGLRSKVEASVNSFTVRGILYSGTVNVTATQAYTSHVSLISGVGRGYRSGNGPCPGSKRDSYASGGGGYGGIGGTVPGSGGGGGCKYGSLTQPTSLGSGAGAGDGSGGGRVYLDAAQVTVNGTISVNGSDSTDADNGGGAGGAVYIDSNSFEGNGSLYARGGRGSDKFSGGGGGGGAGGRISVHFSSEDWSGTTSARSGLTTDGVYGGYGSVYFENTSSGATIRSDPCRLTGLYECDILTGRDRNGDGIVTSSSNNHTVVIPSSEEPELEADKGRLNVSGEELTVNGTLRGGQRSKVEASVGKFTVRGTLYSGTVNVTATQAYTSHSSLVSGVGRGYRPGNGPCPGSKKDSSNSGGGGYGGIGGTVPGSGGGGGCKYGSLTQPTSLGSGAGAGDGSGGGRVYLDTTQVTINGKISVNGSDSTEADNGGGAGGAVYVDTNSLEGNGSLYARGGRGSDKFSGGGGGGGAGGRISVHFSSEDWSGITSARSGLTTDGVYGGYGSIYFENTSSGATIRSDPCRLTGLYECDILTGRDRNGDGIVTSSSGSHTVVIPSSEKPELEADRGRLNVSGERLTVNGTLRGEQRSKVEANIDDFTVRGALYSGTVNVTATQAYTSHSSLVSGVGRGYRPGNGPCPGSKRDSYASGGGGYGGIGGTVPGSGGGGGCKYGSLTQPTSLGSGAGAGDGSGGGRVYLDTTQVTINGTISVNGSDSTDADNGGGAGGAVYVDTNSLEGNGSLYARGGRGSDKFSGGGGGGGAGGRISVHFSSEDWSGTTSARSGLTTDGVYGGYGSIYFENTSSGATIRSDPCRLTGLYGCNILTGRDRNGDGIVTSSSNNHTVVIPSSEKPELEADRGRLNISGERLTVNGTLKGEQRSKVEANVDDFTVRGALYSGTVNVTATQAYTSHSSLVSGVGLGYRPGNGPCPGSKKDSSNSGGGGYGGVGGTVPGSGGGGGCKYGSLTQPTSLGSGAGAGDGSGGGRVYLDTTQVTINGTISVNGSDSTDADNGGGAGGAVYIDSNSFEGNGSLYARGGRGSDKFSGGGGGGGAGGRISVHFSSEDWSGITSVRSGLTSSDGVYGGYGSIYFENTSSGTTIRSDPCRLTGLYECDILTGRDRNGDAIVRSSSQSHVLTVLSGESLQLERDIGTLDGKVESARFEGVVSGKQRSTVRINATKDVFTNGTVTAGTVNISTLATFNASGTVSTDGLGYRKTNGPCPGSGDNSDGSGGGHGGTGGSGPEGSSGGCTYGDNTSPTTLGSGGSPGGGGDGGGRVFIDADVVEIDGRISSNGTSASRDSGGGAGGSVYIRVSSSVNGTGGLFAVGGDGSDEFSGDGGGGGGGGRVAVVGGNWNSTVSVDGGSGTDSGGNGTYYDP